MCPAVLGALGRALFGDRLGSDDLRTRCSDFRVGVGAELFKFAADLLNRLLMCPALVGALGRALFGDGLGSGDLLTGNGDFGSRVRAHLSEFAAELLHGMFVYRALVRPFTLLLRGLRLHLAKLITRDGGRLSRLLRFGPSQRRRRLSVALALPGIGCVGLSQPAQMVSLDQLHHR